MALESLQINALAVLFFNKIECDFLKIIAFALLKPPWFSAGISKSRTGGSLELGPGSERFVGSWGKEVIEIKH